MQAAFLALPTFLQALVFVSATLLAAEVLARITRRIARGLKLDGDLPVTIAVYTVVGTAYGILLSFAVSLVWSENSGTADAVSREALALAELHRSAQVALTPDYAALAGDLSRRYASKVVEAEWPQLRRNHRGDEARTEADEVTSFVTHLPRHAAHDPTSYAMFQTQASRWLEARQARQSAGATDLPGTMWAVLLVGGAVLFVFHGILVMGSRRASFLVLLPLATIIGVELFLIFTLDRPYAGAFAVDPRPFVEFLRVSTAS